MNDVAKQIKGARRTFGLYLAIATYIYADQHGYTVLSVLLIIEIIAHILLAFLVKD